MRYLLAIIAVVLSCQPVEVAAQAPFGSTVPQRTGWRVPPEEAARLIADGWQRRIEPETGNEQWSKSLTHGQPSSPVSPVFYPGEQVLTSCGSSTLKVGGS